MAEIKEIVFIIILALACAGMAVVLVLNISSYQGGSDYEEQIEIYKQNNTLMKEEIAKDLAIIKEREEKKANLTIEKADLTKNLTVLQRMLNETTTQYNDLLAKYNSNILWSEIIGGTSLALNILLPISDFYLRSKISELEQQIKTANSYIQLLDPKRKTAEIYYLDSMLITNATNLIMKKTLIYNASKDGFGLAEYRKKVCGQPQLIVLITTTTNFKFGLLIDGPWSCSKKGVIDPKAIAFSLYNVGYAPVSENKFAFQDLDGYLLYFGEGDIIVKENGEGVITPNKAFQIPAPFDPNSFFYPELKFTAKNVEVFQHENAPASN